MGAMLRFALTRILMTLPTLLIVAVAVFVLIRLIPGDPAQLMLGDLADPASLADLRAQLGLDRSWPVQFGIWFGDMLHGDLGVSITTGQHVMGLVWERFVVSAQIVLAAVLFASVVAVPAGMVAAWKQNRLPDLMLVGGATLLVSIPTFWGGLLLLLFFGAKLQWLPVVGYVSISSDWKTGLLYLVMPVLTLFLHEIGVIMRMARASTLEVLRLDYITHARAKGLSERTVLTRHAFKNAFGPTWTLIGLVLGNLLGGIAVVETVFTIPGLGRLLVDAIFGRDYPVIQGCLLFVAVIYVVVNLVVDLCYPFFDPRVTVE
jgi:peptide/nickel transport system permease protein